MSSAKISKKASKNLSQKTVPTHRDSITFQQAEQLFKQAGAIISVPEAHGTICGLICGGNRMNGRSWLDIVLGCIEPDDNSRHSVREVLLELYNISGEELKSDHFNFNLFLPHDDQPLSDRAKAVGEWCMGVMAGLGFAGIGMDNELNADIREALYHFNEIGRIEYEDLSFSEEDERAYTEVIEYVRAAVLLIYVEFVEQNNLHAVSSFHDQTELLH
ncbi:MAG: hypothetical protein Tsb005_13050 [Gammaproteobacteria bacterium]